MFLIYVMYLGIVKDGVNENLKAIEKELNGKAHSEAKVGQWVDNICAKTIEGLVKLMKPFKYVGKCFYTSYWNIRNVVYFCCESICTSNSFEVAIFF